MRQPVRRSRLALPAVAAFLLLSPAGAHGQALLDGRVVDATSGVAVPQARINISGRERTILSDSSGSFSLTHLPPGGARIRIERVGYEPWEGEVEVPTDPDVTKVFRLVPDPLPLTEVAASATSVNRHLVHFERRRKHHRASGHFLAQEDLVRRENSRLSDVLRAIPGVRILRPNMSDALVATGHTPPGVLVPGQMGRQCLTQVFVDGVKLYGMTAVGSDLPVNIDMFDVRNVAAVEFYSGASSTPVELRTSSAQCGTLAIWSRMQ